jgi:hypothetical protein
MNGPSIHSSFILLIYKVPTAIRNMSSTHDGNCCVYSFLELQRVLHVGQNYNVYTCMSAVKQFNLITCNQSTPVFV